MLGIACQTGPLPPPSSSAAYLSQTKLCAQPCPFLSQKSLYLAARQVSFALHAGEGARGGCPICMPVLSVLGAICSATPVPTAFPSVLLFNCQDGVLPPRPFPAKPETRASSVSFLQRISLHFHGIPFLRFSNGSDFSSVFLSLFVVGEQGPSSHPTSLVPGDRVSFCSVNTHVDGSPLGLSVLRVTVLVEWGVTLLLCCWLSPWAVSACARVPSAAGGERLSHPCSRLGGRVVTALPPSRSGPSTPAGLSMARGVRPWGHHCLF